MSLVEEIKTQLEDNYSLTPKPDFINDEKGGDGEKREQCHISLIGDPKEDIYTVASNPYYDEDTRFQLDVTGYVDEDERDLMIPEIKKHIRAKETTAGRWDIYSARPDDGEEDFGCIFKGKVLAYER